MVLPIERFSAVPEVQEPLAELCEVYAGSKSEFINMCVYYFIQGSDTDRDEIQKVWMDRKKKKRKK